MTENARGITWKVGGTVYVVSERSGSNQEFSVVATGRKWAQLQRAGYAGYRADMATGKVEAAPGYSYGWAWPSLEAYEAEERRQRAWRGLRDLIGGVYRTPEGVTIEDINAAAVMLRLKGDGLTL